MRTKPTKIREMTQLLIVFVVVAAAAWVSRVNGRSADHEFARGRDARRRSTQVHPPADVAGLRRETATCVKSRDRIAASPVRNSRALPAGLTSWLQTSAPASAASGPTSHRRSVVDDNDMIDVRTDAPDDVAIVRALVVRGDQGTNAHSTAV